MCKCVRVSLSINTQGTHSTITKECVKENGGRGNDSELMKQVNEGVMGRIRGLRGEIIREKGGQVSGR